MSVQAQYRKDSHTFKIAGKTHTVHYEVLSAVAGADHISLLVATMEQALQLAYAYRYHNATEIEQATDGRFVVVVYKHR